MQIINSAQSKHNVIKFHRMKNVRLIIEKEKE